MPRSARVHTPLLLQMEAVECGAAALGIVLRYFGAWVPLAELRRECAVSRDGSKASNIVKAARRFGLSAKGYSKDLAGLKQMAFPVIVYWKFNHFLVVEGFSRTHVFLNDPAYGHTRMTLAEFEDGFTGVVLAFEPTPQFQRRGSPPRVLPGIRRRLRGHYGAIAFCVLVGMALVIPGLVVPAFSAVFVDTILIDKRISWARPLMIALVLAAVLQCALRMLQLHVLRRFGMALSARMTSQYLWHLLRLPISFYTQRYPGEIANRNAANERVAAVLSGHVATVLIDVLTMAMYAAFMLSYDATLTGIGVGLAVLNFFALNWIARHRQEADLRLARESGRAAGVAMATLQNLETIKAAGAEPHRFSLWAGHFAKDVNAQRELQDSSMKLSVLPVIMGALSNSAVMLLGSSRVINGQLTIGELFAFQQLMASFMGPMSTLLSLGTLIQGLKGELLLLDDVLDNPVEETLAGPDQTDAANTAVRLDGRLSITGLTFGYNPIEAPLIHEFHLQLEPGARVAFVGGSGSGKSTLARVIAGLFPPWSGRLDFDAKPRGEWPRDLLTSSIAMVDQEVLLFEGTVRDNLTLWDSTIPDDNLLRACRDAVVEDVVAALPSRFDATLPEGGTSLSGGQRQRLEIARALVGNPSILVLDEATSALDAETERIIMDNLRRRGCTCIIVAHRLSTIRDCDEIIVLDRGAVVERGTHDQLWNAGGKYAELVAIDGT